MLSKARGSAHSVFEAGSYVSVLDNYIDVDEKFFLN
jgi:hypothetical protein